MGGDDVIFISAARVEIHCDRCDQPIIAQLEGPRINIADVAVAESEHAYFHAIKDAEAAA